MKKSKISSVITLLFFVVSCGPVSAVSTPTAASATRPALSPESAAVSVAWPGLHAGWTTFKGTPTIQDVIYDPAGYLWATTGKGLYRWNIETSAVNHYSGPAGLPESISAITFYDGKIWAISAKGEIASFSDNRWKKQTTDYGRLDRFFNTGNRLWIAGEKGLYYYEGQGWKIFDSIPKEYEGYVYWIARSKDDSLWFSVSSYEDASNYVLRFDGHTWQNYDNLTGTHKVITTSDGILWFVTYELLISFDGQNLTPFVLPGNYFRYSNLNSLLTPEGDLWLQTNKGTFIIQRQNAKKDEFAGFDEISEEVNGEPTQLTPQGWLFKSEKDIYLYSEKELKKYGLANDILITQLIGNDVIGFAPDGALWVWSGGTPIRFDGKKIDDSFEYYGTGNGSVSHLDSNGGLWSIYPASQRLYYGKPGQKEKEVKGIDLRYPVNDFSFAPDGSIWLALTDGFIANISAEDAKDKDFIELDKIEIAPEYAKYKNFIAVEKAEGERNSNVLSPSRIEVGADGSVWVFILGDGLYKYDGKAWEYYGIPLLADSSAFAIGPNNKVWAGYNRSLYANDGGTWQSYPYNCIFPSHLTIAPDEAVWFINGCDGVYRFDGKDWTHFAREKELDGIVPTKIMVAPDGALWFFSREGWARYKP